MEKQVKFYYESYMNKIRFTFLLFIMAVFIPGKGTARNTGDAIFHLTRQKSGHYTFAANINHKLKATVLLESAIHVLLIDSAFVFDNPEIFDLDIIPNPRDEKMNLGGKTYRISHKATGQLNIGNHTSYRGEIFILAGYATSYEMALPIQNLYNNSDNGSRIVKLDLTACRLQMISRDALDKEKKEHAKLKMNSDTYLKMPAVRTTLKILNEGKTKLLKGNFNLDFGNASFLFLFDQNKAVQRFLRANPDIKLQKAYNKAGKEIAAAMIAKDCELCDLYFKNPVIAVTKLLPRFTTTGNIGIKFFEEVVAVFDFKTSSLYFSKRKPD